MSKLQGYAGKILEVDLTTRSTREVALSPDLAARFIGGKGLNAWFAHQYIKPNTPAFSPANALILGAGPLAGTLAPAAGKTSLAAKSPLSQYIGTSNSGHMGMLKYAGYDHVIITGKADTPVYLELGDEVRIRAAAHLWGKDVWETTDAIWRDLGRHYAVAGIGPAGEKLVRNASVVANKYSLFAKTGMGAVMGAKNLKAIATGGSHGVGVANPQRFMSIVNRMRKRILRMKTFAQWRHLGTLASVESMMDATSLPFTYQNAKEQCGDREVLAGLLLPQLDAILDRHGSIACLGCFVGCKHSFRLKPDVPHAGLSLGVSCAGAPAANFGSNAAVHNWADSMKCEELVHRLGMDNAVAGIVAWAIELYEKGIITRADTDGMELDWTPAVVEELLRKMAYREGFGDILADGCIEGAQRLGRGSEYYALHYKGVPNSTGDPRPRVNTWFVSLVTSVIGHAPGCAFLYEQPRPVVEHQLRRFGLPAPAVERVLAGIDQNNRGWVTRYTEDIAYVLNSLGVCVWDFMQAQGLETWADLYTAATGINMDAAGLIAAAARGTDLEKAFNLREGASRNDDTVPNRFLTEPIRSQGELRPPLDRGTLDQMVTDYYVARGWDAQHGTLSASRMAELGLAATP